MEIFECCKYRVCRLNTHRDVSTNTKLSLYNISHDNNTTFFGGGSISRVRSLVISRYIFLLLSFTSFFPIQD